MSVAEAQSLITCPDCGDAGRWYPYPGHTLMCPNPECDNKDDLHQPPPGRPEPVQAKLIAESIQESQRRPNSYLGEGILLQNDIAWVTPERYEHLDVYDSSIPTGVYIGKCWKRNDSLGFYVQTDPPQEGWVDTCFRPILVMPEPAFTKDLCATCGHPKLSHMVGRPNPCNYFRCTCQQYVPA